MVECVGTIDRMLWSFYFQNYVFGSVAILPKIKMNLPKQILIYGTHVLFCLW